MIVFCNFLFSLIYDERILKLISTGYVQICPWIQSTNDNVSVCLNVLGNGTFLNSVSLQYTILECI